MYEEIEFWYGFMDRPQRVEGICEVQSHEDMILMHSRDETTGFMDRCIPSSRRFIAHLAWCEELPPSAHCI